MGNLLEVYDASELKVEVGVWNEGETKYDYTPVKFRRNINPEMPNNDRPVYDGLTLVGTKKQRDENTLTIEEEFQGWGEGLFAYENTNGLVVKITIDPNEGEAPVDNEMYYLNWCPENAAWSAGDEGEVNVSLQGRFDTKTDDEPITE